MNGVSCYVKAQYERLVKKLSFKIQCVQIDNDAEFTEGLGIPKS